MFVLFKRQTSGTTLFTYFKTLHIKRLKFRSQTLVKSLFGITGQTTLLLTMVLSHGPQNVGSFHCNCLPLEPAGQRQTVQFYCHCPYFDMATAYAIDPHSVFSCLTLLFPWFPLSLTLVECFCTDWSTHGTTFERCLLIFQTKGNRFATYLPVKIMHESCHLELRR